MCFHNTEAMRRTAVANKSQPSKALKVVKELDAFPKVPENFKQTSASGGGGIDFVTKKKPSFLTFLNQNRHLVYMVL